MVVVVVVVDPGTAMGVVAEWTPKTVIAAPTSHTTFIIYARRLEKESTSYTYTIRLSL